MHISLLFALRWVDVECGTLIESNNRMTFLEEHSSEIVFVFFLFTHWKANRSSESTFKRCPNFDQRFGL